jgi:serine/threonine protein kinase
VSGVTEVLKSVGRYDVLHELGRGGMAVVYLARQSDLDRLVALKELAALYASDPAIGQRFLRESRVAGSLSHPNVVTVHDYFQWEGTPYIAMEYVPRGSLRPYVGRLTLAQVGGVLEGVLAGLAHGEQHGIVHRDLKPENLMVTSEGRIKIADFGIAKATNRLQNSVLLTQTGTTVGTPYYMAPEQAMAREVGPWTDLYSVGCMAYELFVGRVPFYDTEAPVAILLRHVNEPVPPAASVDSSVPGPISDWIDRLLVKDPELRTRSAGEAWDALEEILIAELGPRWRREARLPDQPEGGVPARSLTPARFDETSPEAAIAPPAPTLAPPGPATPPPSPSAPSPPPIQVGPDTPAPFAVPAPIQVGPDTPAPFAVPAPIQVGPDTPAPFAVPAPPAVPTTARRAPGRRGFGLLVAGIVAVAGTAGVLAARAGDEDGAPRRTQGQGPVLTADAGTLQAPAGWRAVAAPDMPGLELTDAAAVAPGAPAGAAVVLGTAPASAHTSALAPAALLGEDAPEPEPVSLSERVQAYRHRGLALDGDRRLTLYAVPTEDAVATVACVAPAGAADDFAAACEDIATTFAPAGDPQPVGPSAAHAQAVRAAFPAPARLARDRAALRDAETPRAQGSAAAALGRRYRAGATALARVEPPLQAAELHADLVAAVREAGAAYGAMATAARAGARRRFARAGDRAERAERAVTAALRAYARAGYPA